MVLLVPFDGSPLSKAALTRAMEFADYRDEAITALSVIPDDAEYARERGWIDADEAFDVEAIADRMREQVETVAPSASFRSEVPERELDSVDDDGYHPDDQRSRTRGSGLDRVRR